MIGLITEGRPNAAAAGISEKAVQHVSRIHDLIGPSADAEDHRRVLAVVHYLNG